MKIRNKFYVGHMKTTSVIEQAQINPPAMVPQPTRWTRATLQEAIAHAELLLENHPEQESYVIVQMVRVVRRQKAPTVVEHV